MREVQLRHVAEETSEQRHHRVHVAKTVFLNPLPLGDSEGPALEYARARVLFFLRANSLNFEVAQSAQQSLTRRGVQPVGLSAKNRAQVEYVVTSGHFNARWHALSALETKSTNTVLCRSGKAACRGTCRADRAIADRPPGAQFARARQTTSGCSPGLGMNSKSRSQIPSNGRSETFTWDPACPSKPTSERADGRHCRSAGPCRGTRDGRFLRG